MRHTFFGGVTPAPRKKLTRRKPIAPLDLVPVRVTIPLRAGAEDMAEALVKPGDRVLVGQPIARVEQTGLTVHASVSGRVAQITDCPHPWGGLCPAVVIENDGQGTPWTAPLPPLDPEQLTLALLLERVTACGVVGMGGGAHSTAEKLRQASGRITYLIVNAAECEPYVSADHRLLLEHGEEILSCAQRLAYCLRATHVALVTQGDKLNAADLAERQPQLDGVKTDVITLRTRYPLGSEKQVVQTVTGQELGLGRTPLDAGCLVLNTATVYAVHQALFEGRPLTHRAVTVSGGGIVRPRNLWVPVGVPLRHLLEECGQLRDGASQLLTGGVMMGRPVESLDAPICKDTNCFIALSDEERRDEGETACIRCGKCVASCPMRLAPSFIAKAYRQEDLPLLRKFHVEDCISCGCCSFVCPANIPLVELTARAAELLNERGER